MANDTETVSILKLALELDKQSNDQAKRGLADLGRALKQVEADNAQQAQSNQRVARAFNEVDSSVQNNINSLRRRLAVAQIDASERLKAIRSLREEADARDLVSKAALEQAESARRAVSSSGSAGSAGTGQVAQRVSAGFSSVAQLLPGDAGNVARTLADIAGALDDIPQAAQAVQPALAGLNVGIGSLAVAGVAAVAVGAMAVAISKFVSDIQEQQADLDATTAQAVETYRLIDTATAETLEARKAELEAEIRYREQVIASAEAGAQAAEAVGGFQGAVADLFNFLSDATGLFGTGKVEKDLGEEIEDYRRQLNSVNTALASDEVQARRTAEAIQTQAVSQSAAAQSAQTHTQATQRADAAERQRTQAVQTATTAINTQEQALKRLSEARVDYRAQLADIRESFADQTRSLEQRRTDLIAEAEDRRLEITRNARRQEEALQRRAVFVDAQQRRRSEFDARIEAARSELAARQAARRTELEIFDASLERDFAQIASIRRNEKLSNVEQSETAALDAEIQKQTEAFEAQERLLEAAFDKQERALAIQEQFEDHRINLAKQLANLQRDFNTLHRQQLQQELDARNAFIKALFDARVAAVQAMGGQVYTFSNIVKRAGGGPLAAGQPSWVNELPGQRERFNGMMLPAGKGLFIPSQAGMVSNTTNHNQRSLTVNIYESRDTRRTRQMVEEAFDRYLS